jgi:phosphoglycerate kinase
MTFPFRTLDDPTLSGTKLDHRRVLMRVDVNVPMDNGIVTDMTRITRLIPGIRELINKNAKVILLAHFGRPKNGPDQTNSLRPVASAIERALGAPVTFVDDCIGSVAKTAISGLPAGSVIMLENTRFYPEEERNDRNFVAALAELGDIYVNDAFSCAHRAHASTEGLAQILPAFAGRTMQAELEALTKALENPIHPVAAVVGGAKVSTKIELLGNLVKKVDVLMIGGGMANTFLAAHNKPVGKSLCEIGMVDLARSIMATARDSGCTIHLPIDVRVAQTFKANAPSHNVATDAVGPEDMILDIGAASIAALSTTLQSVRTLVWNGPFGAFEMEPFDTGTNAMAQAAARLTKAGTLTSVAGGGDTVAALNKAGAAEDFTYISTAGGAFLEWLEGKTLPGVEALRHR